MIDTKAMFIFQKRLSWDDIPEIFPAVSLKKYIGKN